MKYNYYEEVKEDLRSALADDADYIDINTLTDRDELEEYCNENYWADDRVTGNASGSYTFNRTTAKEYVLDNIDLYNEALAELSGDPYRDAGKALIDGEWEAADVTIRCYVLSWAVSDLMEEYEENNVFEDWAEEYYNSCKAI